MQERERGRETEREIESERQTERETEKVRECAARVPRERERERRQCVAPKWFAPPEFIALHIQFAAMSSSDEAWGALRTKRRRGARARVPPAHAPAAELPPVDHPAATVTAMVSAVPLQRRKSARPCSCPCPCRIKQPPSACTLPDYPSAVYSIESQDV